MSGRVFLVYGGGVGEPAGCGNTRLALNQLVLCWRKSQPESYSTRPRFRFQSSIGRPLERGGRESGRLRPVVDFDVIVSIECGDLQEPAPEVVVTGSLRSHFSCAVQAAKGLAQRRHHRPTRSTPRPAGAIPAVVCRPVESGPEMLDELTGR